METIQRMKEAYDSLSRKAKTAVIATGLAALVAVSALGGAKIGKEIGYYQGAVDTEMHWKNARPESFNDYFGAHYIEFHDGTKLEVHSLRNSTPRETCGYAKFQNMINNL